MRKFLIAIIAVLAVSFTAMAQDTPKAEVFGGYQYLRFNPGSGLIVVQGYFFVQPSQVLS